jgi:predicted nucleotidyltransferase
MVQTELRAESMPSQINVAHRVAGELSAVDGVIAVVLGGSVARGHATPTSDVDLGIYYHPDDPPSLDALRSVASRLDDRGTGDAVTTFGEWGSWINGGAWLRINGIKVDWLYRDISQVVQSIEEGRRGQVAVYYQPGHPFGFASFTYMGEINICLPLYDPQDVIASLKALTTPYPDALKRTIIDRFLWEASFALETAHSSADHGDVVYVAGCLFRSVSCMVQVLFALNERYLINEKHALVEADDLPLSVSDFAETVEDILGHSSTRPAELHENLQRMGQVLNMVRTVIANSIAGS